MQPCVLFTHLHQLSSISIATLIVLNSSNRPALNTHWIFLEARCWVRKNVEENWYLYAWLSTSIEIVTDWTTMIKIIFCNNEKIENGFNSNGKLWKNNFSSFPDSGQPNPSPTIDNFSNENFGKFVFWLFPFYCSCFFAFSPSFPSNSPTWHSCIFQLNEQES